MRKANTWLAQKITKIVGTMWCAHIFAVLGCITMYAAFTSNTQLVLIGGSISGYFLQLWLLPIIMVGQQTQTEAIQQQHASHQSLHAKLDRVLQHHGDIRE